MLTFIETILAVALLFYIAWTALHIFLRTRLGSRLMEEITPYDALTTDYAKTLLILGDSTGVGVGADRPEDTIAARLAARLGATYVENQSKSGAGVDDLTTQIQHLRLSHYHVIFIMIGANDMLAFKGAKTAAARLKEILETLPDAERVFLMPPGNVGGAKAIPFFARMLFTHINKEYHKAFGRLAKEEGITYINLYRRPSEDVFIKQPDIYLAADSFHPSSNGYEEWFRAIEAKI